MSRWKRPLTASEVKKILKSLGFTQRPHKGTGHEQWCKGGDGEPFKKVTVSAHNQPFDDFIIGSMARQAGVSVKSFYDALG